MYIVAARYRGCRGNIETQSSPVLNNDRQR